MIYYDDHIWDFDLQQALAEVSPQRREYALRYRQERDQRLCVAAYRLLQRALLQEYGLSVVPQFTRDDKGKPALCPISGAPGPIHFSLSHCCDAVVCAVGAEAVGIDIETVDGVDTSVVARVMSEKEQRQIAADDHPDMAFCRLWTMKESLYKLTGDDNDGDIRHMLDKPLPVIFETTVFPQGICTVCRYLAGHCV